MLMLFNKAVDCPIVTLIPYKKKYKVALCISGEVRDLSNINFFLRQLVYPFYHCDVFLHCNFRHPSIREEYIKRLKPKLIIEKSMSSKNITHVVFGRIYELHHAVLAYEEVEDIDYDLYIRIRPDVVLSRPLSEYDLLQASKGFFCCTLLLNALYIVGIDDYMSDIIFVANRNTMTEFVKIYNYIQEHSVTCKNPEALLHSYLKNKNFNIHYSRTEICLSDYYILNSKKVSLLKMFSKIKDFPLLDRKDCLVV
jgi:hypothetical protein